MVHFRKPLFRAARGLWHVWHDGKLTNLGPDDAAAFTAWRELTAKPSAPVVTPTQAQRLVVVLVDQFFDW